MTARQSAMRNLIVQYASAMMVDWQQGGCDSDAVADAIIREHPEEFLEFTHQSGKRALVKAIADFFNDNGKATSSVPQQMEMGSVIDQLEDIIPALPRAISYKGPRGRMRYIAWEMATGEMILEDIGLDHAQIEAYTSRIAAKNALLQRRREMGVSDSESIYEWAKSREAVTA